MSGVSVEVNGERYHVSSLTDFDQLVSGGQDQLDTIPYEILSHEFLSAQAQPLPQQQQQGVRLSGEQREAASNSRHSESMLITPQMGSVVSGDVDAPDAGVPAFLQRQMG